MKILHTVESYYPSVGGMQEVTKQISEELVKLGHEVIVATSFNNKRNKDVIGGVRVNQFKIGGGIVKGLVGDAEEMEKYKKFVLEGNFDIVTNFAAQQWATDLILPILKKIKSKKVFVPTGFSGLYSPAYREYFENLKITMKYYDWNVFLSEDYRDINFAREIGIKNFSIIPNGASENEFETKIVVDIRKKLNIPINEFVVLLVGSHSGLKGHKEAIRIFRKAKIENSCLVIVGNGKTSCTYLCKIKSALNNFLNKNNKILVENLCRQDTVDLYKSADVFLFPSYIECSPLVLFESMASKIPFVVTDVGNSKEIIEWSKGGLTIKTTIDKNGYSLADIRDGARILRELYDNNDLRHDLGHNGYRAWKTKFTWSVISKKYETLYESLVNE